MMFGCKLGKWRPEKKNLFEFIFGVAFDCEPVPRQNMRVMDGLTHGLSIVPPVTLVDDDDHKVTNVNF